MKTILIVDDELEIAETLGFLLASEGFRVETAGDGLEGLEKVAMLRPDLALVDVMMPRMDGRELCKAMRADAQLRSTPIMFMSAAYRNVGEPCADVPLIRKPFNLEELLCRIREMLGLNGTEGGSAASGPRR